jgi:predicted nucleic acid-binding protein
MTQIIVLDSGPLSLLSSPRRKAEAIACSQWLRRHLSFGTRVLIPEIADYEIRRELLRARKTASVVQLDRLAGTLEYLPLTTTAMRKAAEFWAIARQAGQPTAGDNTIDGDCILAGQADSLGLPGIIVATTNVGHLSRYVPASLWSTIV